MRKILATALLALGLAMPTHAATTFDFIGDNPNGADAPGDWNGFNERGEADGTILQFGGVYIMFSATASDGDGFAYFDSGTAGLGVCATLGTKSDGEGDVVDQCKPSTDDNLDSGETLTLSFFSDAEGQNAIDIGIMDIVFRDADHGVITAFNFHLVGTNFADGDYSMNNFSTGTASNSYTFSYATENASQYYISSISVIPEPATWLMLILGFGMVGMATRRRTKIALA